MQNILTKIGRAALAILAYIGEVAQLAMESFLSIFSMHVRWRLVMRHIVEIGARSQMVVIVTGAFTGAVFSAQLYFQLQRLGMASTVGSVTAVAMFRELGPALAGLMVAGRVGASIAAEIGTMKVTEQVDALRSIGVHPVDYLVVPRVAAMMISMPLLVAECCAFSVLSANYVALKVLGIAEAGYMRNLIFYVGLFDIYKALIKGFVFGLILVFVACREGLRTENGAAGVGRAPTEAVVISSLAILAVNFILTFALNIIFPAS
jgi:phospholipid/cholesterol/gamma-HCH transport system permease protein